MGCEMDGKTILIIDDDRDISEAIQHIIDTETQYRTLWIAESDLVLLSAPHVRPSLILLDYLMPVMDGLSLYDRLQAIPTIQGVPVVLISAATSLPYEELRKRQIRLLRKPFNVQELLDVIAELALD
ncbi:MAG: response regulator [Ktedonobacteraceae bacterium]|nr:response regulator [Ktedonobacteraceae bacterium]